ncbi:MAG: FadR family transcriptional regulator [Bacteroidia bacterium]|nr:FadR family transcriptional regulator [Bacteroidia bacterium]
MDLGPTNKILSNFQEIAIANPVDMIIRQIRDLITSGQLSPGDKLPPERKLAEVLRVSRTNVRDAIKKLEFYGILKTLPQSGTIVAGMGITALEGLITDVLKLEVTDFNSLVETRVLLEKHAAGLAAQRRTEEDIENIRIALAAYEKKVEEGGSAVEEDLLFHLQIAEASKNSVLKSLMLIITPDIVKSFNELGVCKDGRSQKALEEHMDMFQLIIDGKSEEVMSLMELHLSDIIEYSRKSGNK